MSYVMELYSAPWCANCAVLKKRLADAGVSYTEVDCDSSTGMVKAAELGIKSLPTAVIHKDGQMLRKIHGLQPLDVYLEYINSPVHETHSEVVALNG